MRTNIDRMTKFFYCPDYPHEELARACDCDKCLGACDDNNCGECFNCEDIKDDAQWWEINREDILGI